MFDKLDTGVNGCDEEMIVYEYKQEHEPRHDKPFEMSAEEKYCIESNDKQGKINKDIELNRKINMKPINAAYKATLREIKKDPLYRIVDKASEDINNIGTYIMKRTKYIDRVISASTELVI